MPLNASLSPSQRRCLARPLRPRSIYQVLLLTLLLLTIAGCDFFSHTTTEIIPPTSTKRPGEPIIRVRLAANTTELSIIGPRQVQITIEGDRHAIYTQRTPLKLQRANGQWLGPFGSKPPASNATLVIASLGPVPIKLASGASYHGYLRIVPKPQSSKDHFDVINHLRIEQYLPGVLDKELYDHWKPAAFIAQAIAARTYAIDRMHNYGAGRHYDLESTQASQAYQGRSLHPIALRAVADTMGLVLTWQDRLFTPYYSSTCGGTRQSSTDAFGLPGRPPAPLNPTRPTRWCEGTRHDQWGPIHRDRLTLSRRLVAWGKAGDFRGNVHDQARARLRHLGILRNISIHHNAIGRPTSFTLRSESGQTYRLNAEQFRLAMNYRPSAHPLKSSLRLKSSYVTVQITDTQVILRGRGFGHGVGLCQYGAQSMAQQGKNAIQILTEYYPQSKIQRAY